MADDNDNSSSNNSDKESVNYVRKKNIIPGWDNDHLIIGIGLLGLAAAVAPYAAKLIDNLRNMSQQLPQPPNGVQQQPVYLPPTQVNLPSPENHTHIHEHEHEAPSPLAEHEQGMKDQRAYEAAAEKETATAPVSFNMIPDRSTQVSNKNQNKSKGNYEAGSNISGSYS